MTDRPLPVDTVPDDALSADTVPADALPGRAAPTAARAVAPRPPGPLTGVLTRFWAGARAPMPTTALVGSAVAGVAGGVVLVGHRPGLGAAVVGLVVWLPALHVLARRRSAGDAVTAALSLAFLVVVAVRDAGWVVALCTVVAVWAGAVAVTGARSAPAVVLSAPAWAAGLLRAVPWVKHAAGGLAGSRRDHLRAAARTGAVTLGLLVVFGLLFARADRVFASYLPSLTADRLPGQVVVGALVAVVTAGLAHLALAPPALSDVAVRPGRPVRRVEWLVPVLALDALVLAFVLVQVGALLGGHRHVLATAGLSYAEYAREGFAQLVVVTALTLVVVAVAARRAPRGSTRDALLTRLALGLLCGATLGVVASALRRMDLYVDAFGLTRLRVLAVTLELLLAVVLVLVLVAGARWPSTPARWLPRAVVHATATAALALAVANPDALIVRHNAAADLDGGLDVGYLQGLSADGVAAMAALDEPLRSCLLRGVGVDAPAGPVDWNLGRARAADALAGADPTGWSPCRPRAIRRAGSPSELRLGPRRDHVGGGRGIRTHENGGVPLQRFSRPSLSAAQTALPCGGHHASPVRRVPRARGVGAAGRITVPLRRTPPGASARMWAPTRGPAAPAKDAQ